MVFGTFLKRLAPIEGEAYRSFVEVGYGGDDCSR